LALARALLRKPDVLVLDEATSALDSESERSIQAAVEALTNQMTIIVIAHRLSTVRQADYVYVLSEGTVVEEGPYSELAQQKEGRLASMIRQQTL
jgi:ABC-type multidrug transport system fused ATPase/permease subunit